MQSPFELPCGHKVCTNCLRRLVVREDENLKHVFRCNKDKKEFTTEELFGDDWENIKESDEYILELSRPWIQNQN